MSWTPLGQAPAPSAPTSTMRPERKSPRPRPPGTTVPCCFCHHQAKPACHRHHPDTHRLRPRSPDHPGHCSFDGDCDRAHFWPPPCPASPAYKKTPACTPRLTPLPSPSQTSSLGFPLHYLSSLTTPSPQTTATAVSASWRSRPPLELPRVPGGGGGAPPPFLLHCRRVLHPLRRFPSPPSSPAVPPVSLIPVNEKEDCVPIR
jgi:hypothetical protein